jgi:hypothetical protein
MPPAWVRGDPAVCGGGPMEASGVECRHVRLALRGIPGCKLDAWMSDYAMPERAVALEEQIWSNIMDPVAAAKFLDQKS